VTNQIFDSILHDFYSSRMLFDFSERALLETGATGAAIALKRGDVFLCCAKSGETSPVLGAQADSNSGLTGACIRDRVTVICNDINSDFRVDAEVCEQLGIASLIVVPIVRGEQTLGVIEALSSEAQAFGPEQQKFLEALAREIDPEYLPAEWTPIESDEPVEPEYAASVSGPPAIEDSQFREQPALTLTGESSQLLSTITYPRRRVSRLAVATFLACAAMATTVGTYSYFAGKPHRNAAASAQPATTPAAEQTTRQPQSDSPSEEIATGNDLDSIERTARAGVAASQMRLADILARGDGMGKDLVTACAWYTLASMAGYTNSSQQLATLSQTLSDTQIGEVRIQVGQMFASGIGVKRDLTAAYTWLLLANVAGADRAVERRQELSQEMTPAQIAAAKQRANAWLVQHHLSPLKH
jgi:GAF domain